MSDASPTGITPAIADYAVLSELGAGSVGVSFLATPPARLATGDDPVVVRAVRLPVDGDRAARRLLEAAAAIATARSEQLAPVLDAGLDGDLVWVTRPWSASGTLAEPAEPLDMAGRVRAVADVARAAHALHEVGVAHRRITPSNVLLAADGGARLADAGLGHLLVPGRTLSPAEATRTSPWLDPATLRGEKPGRASDIWSIGLLLLEAVGGKVHSGTSPAGGELDRQQVVLDALRGAPAPLLGLTSSQAELVRWCLEPNPARRPRTAAELADRIEHLDLAGDDGATAVVPPLSADPPPVREPTTSVDPGWASAAAGTAPAAPPAPSQRGDEALPPMEPTAPWSPGAEEPPEHERSRGPEVGEEPPPGSIPGWPPPGTAPDDQRPGPQAPAPPNWFASASPPPPAATPPPPPPPPDQEGAS